METDVLIIGSGVAGLNCALKASQYEDVIIATKDKSHESNTFYAQGGLAGVFGKDDSVEAHVQDTLRAGDGLSNKKIAYILALEAPKRILELKKIGVKFDIENGNFILSREAVHSRARIVHSADNTGEEIEKILIKKAKENKKIICLEHLMAVELLTEKNSCFGCSFINVTNNTQVNIFSKITILATGGIGRLYTTTTNPEIATGDGLAMAFKAGAVLENMEFMQFHPTMLHNSEPSFLISETLRGEGGLLKNKFGKSYMRNYHRDGDLAPRDVVSKFTLFEMQKTKSEHVYLDMTHFDAEYLKKRFPHIYQECRKYGIDITKDMIPVSPAAHYLCGGIKTDECGRTNVKNLYAIGECACTGLHGADRLASNSITEGLVFGTRAADNIKNKIGRIKIKQEKMPEFKMVQKKELDKLRENLQMTMWNNVGIIRNKKGLEKALSYINDLEKQYNLIKGGGINKEIIELGNLILIGKIITISALRREESRGTHFIEERPERNDKVWQKSLTIDRNYFKSLKSTF